MPLDCREGFQEISGEDVDVTILHSDVDNQQDNLFCWQLAHHVAAGPDIGHVRESHDVFTVPLIPADLFDTRVGVGLVIFEAPAALQSDNLV